MHLFAKGGHGYGLRRTELPVTGWPQLAEQWLRTIGAIKVMPTLIEKPMRIEAAGNKPKLIDEYVGRVNSGTSAASVAHMRSPGGWQEPGQTPQFDEFTVVLRGMLRVEHAGGALDVRAGQAVIAHKGEWVRYSTPEAGRRGIYRRVRARVLAGHRASRSITPGASECLVNDLQPSLS